MADPVLIGGGATAGEISNVLTGLGLDLVDNLIKDLFTTEREDEEGEVTTFEVGEDIHQIAEVVTDPRTFLDTPLEEYTVSEGLLLMILFTLFVSACWRMIKGAFSWL